MEARFLLTPQDVYHYHLFGYRHLRRFRLWALFLLAIALLAVALPLLPVPLFIHQFHPQFRLVASVMLLLGVALNVAFYKHFLLTRAAIERPLQGEHHLLLGPSGIVYRSWRGERFIPWRQVRAIEQDASNLYFLLAVTGPLANKIWTRNNTPLFLERVCIVPRWSFANPLDAGTFFDTATALRGSADPTERSLGDRVA